MLCKVARIHPLLLFNNRQPTAAHISFISKLKKNVKEMQKGHLDLNVLFPNLSFLKNYSKKSPVILLSVSSVHKGPRRPPRLRFTAEWGPLAADLGWSHTHTHEESDENSLLWTFSPNTDLPSRHTHNVTSRKRRHGRRRGA